jgi:hypothetical protein
MVIDSFTFFNELDILEMRLEILGPYVDFFIITESNKTFSGKDKPLYYAENKERFKKWDKQIVHNVVNVEATDSFDMAFKQKESIKDCIQGFCHNDTIVFYGDVDEIWNPQALKVAAETSIMDDDSKIYNLEQLNYCYYLNQRSSERWVGTVVGKWGIMKTQTLAHWRATHTNEIPNAGWHFTNMGGADQIRKKLDAYDHQEFNTGEVKNNIESNLKYGWDYVGRSHDWEGKPFLFTVDESQLPSYIINNKEKYVAYFK